MLSPPHPSQPGAGRRAASLQVESCLRCWFCLGGGSGWLPCPPLRGLGEESSPRNTDPPSTRKWHFCPQGLLSPPPEPASPLTPARGKGVGELLAAAGLVTQTRTALARFQSCHQA